MGPQNALLMTLWKNLISTSNIPINFMAEMSASLASSQSQPWTTGSSPQLLPEPLKEGPYILLEPKSASNGPEPNSAHHLFLQVKFYGNTGSPICLYITCGCFPATVAQLGSCDRDPWPEILTTSSLKEESWQTLF